MRETFWHGSTRLFSEFDHSKTIDGGLHVGSRAQAIMRNSPVLYQIEVDLTRIRRSRDCGGNWASRVKSARASGFEAISYLNRYEGIPMERIKALAASDRLSNLDALTDRAFRKLVPEAEDSLILLPGASFKIVARHLRKPKTRETP